MYRELATIKNGKDVTGFVIYDGLMTDVVDMETMKEMTERGLIDTLSYKDGKFIPVLEGNTEKEMQRMGKKAFKRYKEWSENMTFEEYVAYDCIFREQDVEMMLANQDVVLASVCTAFEGRIRDKKNWSLTMAFWSRNKQAMKKIKNSLNSYAPYVRTVKKMRDYDGFILVNLPVVHPKCDFNLLSFQMENCLNFLYNLEMLETMRERTEHTVSVFPFLQRKILEHMLPTSEGLAGLTGVLREANRLSYQSLSHRTPSLVFNKDGKGEISIYENQSKQ